MKYLSLFIFFFVINHCNAQIKNEDPKKEPAWRLIRPASSIPFDSVRSNIIGKWKDQNSTTTFFHNGAYSTKFISGEEEIGRWKNTSKQIFFSANGTSIDDVYNIIHLSGSLMKTQLVNGTDTTTWIARKLSN